jgi:hypothetical protein
VPALDYVPGRVGYVEPGPDAPWQLMYEPPAGEPVTNCTFHQTPVLIRDLRAVAPRLSLDREGFELWDAPSSVRDFRDRESAEPAYVDEVIELALAATGARRALVFDQQLRRREAGRPAPTFGRHGDGRSPAAVGRVHNDYTKASGPRRAHAVLASHALAAPRGRFAIVNVWRSIKGAIVDTPLAVVDARSVDATDLVATEIRYVDRRGELHLVRANPLHRWGYFSTMDRDDALVFKQFDSLSGAACFVPHAAFDLPQVPPEAPLRESIEARVLVLYD